ncbi:MAG: extracellular solute-binding protein [Patescibacteria group bacterium]|nr:extracellular solute-binding protein [Patescibacteria group bacterium]
MDDQNKQNAQNNFFPSDDPPVNVGANFANHPVVADFDTGASLLSGVESVKNVNENLLSSSQTVYQSVGTNVQPDQPVFLENKTQADISNDTSDTNNEPSVSQEKVTLGNDVSNNSDDFLVNQEGKNLLDILEKKVQQDQSVSNLPRFSNDSSNLIEQNNSQADSALDVNVPSSLDVGLDIPIKDSNKEIETNLADLQSGFNTNLPQNNLKEGLQSENIQQVAQSGPPTPQATDLMTQKSTNRPFPKFVLFVLLGFVLVLFVAVVGFVLYRNSGQTKTVGDAGKIVWWGLTMDESVLLPLIEQFESENPGVDVTYIKQSPKDYRERLINALASEKGPDIFEIHNTWPVMFTPYLSSLPESVMTKSQFNSSFYPIMTSDLVTTKGVIAMPLVYDALTLYINTDVFTAASLEPPKYWSDFQSLVDSGVLFQVDPQSKKILQSPVAFGITGNVDYWPEIIGLMMYQNRVDFSNLDSQPMIDVFNFYKYFHESRGVWNSSMPDSTIAFSKNQLAMYFGPTRKAQEIVQANPNLRFKTVLLPQIQPERPTDPVYSYATYWVYSVYEKSANVDISWKLLKFMASEDSLRKLNQIMESQGKLPVLTSRPDLNLIYADHPVLGSVFALAKDARSWYLADETHDGATGINTQLNKIFEERMLNRDAAFNSKVVSLLAQFGISPTRNFSSN